MSDKIKYEMEFPIHASPSLLFQYISTPSGMQEWYADNVNSRGEFFTFIWEGSEEKAKLVSKNKLRTTADRKSAASHHIRQQMGKAKRPSTQPTTQTLRSLCNQSIGSVSHRDLVVSAIFDKPNHRHSPPQKSKPKHDGF